MKVAVFSTKPYDSRFLEASNQGRHEFTFFEERLTSVTAPLAAGFPAICAFVNDQLDAPTLRALHATGNRVIVLRSAGFNNVDLKEAAVLGIKIARVPAYSPHAVAEFAVGLALTLNRKFHRAYNRVRDGNFSLEGLLGFDIHSSTVGMVGTGKIGLLTARIFAGMGARILGYDPYVNQEFVSMGGEYVPLEVLLQESDIVSLHCPLTIESHHLIQAKTLSLMKQGAMLINTSRGGLVKTSDVIEALKSGRLGAVGLDVYELEAEIFFEDRSDQIIQDDVLQRLLAFSNVLVTSHQAFFTETALRNIADTTVMNLTEFEQGKPLANEVKMPG